MQKEKAMQATRNILASSKAIEAELSRAPAPKPQQIIVIDDSDEDESELIAEEDDGDDDLMFNETVVVEAD